MIPNGPWRYDPSPLTVPAWKTGGLEIAGWHQVDLGAEDGLSI